MQFRRCAAIIAVLAASACTFAQDWVTSYDAALEAKAAGNWSSARDWMLRAVEDKKKDSSKPTEIKSASGEKSDWREGSPYSANFGAAYFAYRQALTTADSSERSALLLKAADELTKLVKGRQESPEAYAVLGQVFQILQDQRALTEVGKDQAKSKMSWKIDQALLTDSDKRLTAAVITMQKNRQGTPVFEAGDPRIDKPLIGLGTPTGQVPHVLTKYALIIGTSESQIEGGQVPFASTDATSLRETLVSDAGYAPENVDLVINATAAEIKTAAQALASRMHKGGTVFLFFSGTGVNIDGKDWIAGIEATSMKDTAAMVQKTDLLRTLMQGGGRIFTFYQVHRPIVDGRCFGQEIPGIGAISQMMGTLPGQQVLAVPTEGQERGIFAQAISQVLDDLQSNGVPIMNFGWQVFNAMRGGSSGQEGGGGLQTPTLPVLIFMAREARF
jgi:hypothetical protein